MKVAVYCFENEKVDACQAMAAKLLGYAFAKSGITLVYGGDSRGLMGIVARTALDAGGKVIGVALKDFAENVQPGLTETHFVDTLSERKDKMTALSDASVTMPGMDGTLDEYYSERTQAKAARKAIENGRVSERNQRLAERPVLMFDPNGYYMPQRAQAIKAGKIKGNGKDLERFNAGICETIAEVFEGIGLPDAPLLKQHSELNLPVPRGKGVLGMLRTKRRYFAARDKFTEDRLWGDIREYRQASAVKATAGFVFPAYAAAMCAHYSDIVQGANNANEFWGFMGVLTCITVIAYACVKEGLTGKPFLQAAHAPDPTRAYGQNIPGLQTYVHS